MAGDNNKDALRVALGSILAPKRPSPSRSSASSGTATPLHNHYPHIHPYPHVHHPPPHSHSTPHHPSTPSRLSHGGDTHHQLPSPIYEPAHHVYQPNFGLPPRLSRNPSSQGHVPGAASISYSHSLSHPTDATSPASVSASAPALTIEAPSPISASASGSSMPPSPQHEYPAHHAVHGLPTPPRSNGGSGTGTPTSVMKGKFLEKLEGKTQSAWDALIHGSFS
ncbi:hypothetical protein D9758_007957 [Tetrapyrgos nigripes]|uniref:Uncharacterized protein n=1 Tax=Tetrapyrgos nigripes TaxID=182062 RepID=A0A8H5D3M4_9AGAR|nr:hypothetical protein D9758_007957 [Tetrapyrgos nigripes]